MARCARKRKRRSRNGKAHRRVVGPAAAAGAVLAAAMTPLVAAPPATADGFDSIIDPVINSIAGCLSGLFDPLAGFAAGPGVAPVGDLASSNLGGRCGFGAHGRRCGRIPAVIGARHRPDLRDGASGDNHFDLHRQRRDAAVHLADDRDERAVCHDGKRDEFRLYPVSAGTGVSG